MHKVFYWNNARFSQCIPYPMYFFYLPDKKKRCPPSQVDSENYNTKYKYN